MFSISEDAESDTHTGMLRCHSGPLPTPCLRQPKGSAEAVGGRGRAGERKREREREGGREGGRERERVRE